MLTGAERTPGRAVKGKGIAHANGIERLALLTNPANAHFPGNNCRMGRVAPGAQADPVNDQRIELQHRGRVDNVGHQDGRASKRRYKRLLPRQIAQRSLEQIVNIDVARLQIRIVEPEVLLAQIAQHAMPGVGGAAPLFAQQVAGHLIQLRIVQQRVVAGKDRGNIGAVFLLRQRGQPAQIVQRAVDGLAQALLLGLEVG